MPDDLNLPCMVDDRDSLSVSLGLRRAVMFEVRVRGTASDNILLDEDAVRQLFNALGKWLVTRRPGK